MRPVAPILFDRTGMQVNPREQLGHLKTTSLESLSSINQKQELHAKLSLVNMYVAVCALWRINTKKRAGKQSWNKRSSYMQHTTNQHKSKVQPEVPGFFVTSMLTEMRGKTKKVHTDSTVMVQSGRRRSEP